MTTKYQFPDCLHPVGAALHMLGCSPAGMVVELPRDTWWKVRCEIDRRWPQFMQQRFDGRGALSDEFECMGMRFRARSGT